MRIPDTSKITTLALLLAMGCVLGAFEGLLPPLPLGMRFGLSNVATMYALFFLGRREALLLATLKSSLALFARGPAAGLLSLCGGLLSLCALALLPVIFRGASYAALGVGGALAHNIGQLGAASCLVSTNLLPVYLPLLLLLGVGTGLLTGILLGAVMPLLGKRAFLAKPGRSEAGG